MNKRRILYIILTNNEEFNYLSSEYTWRYYDRYLMVSNTNESEFSLFPYPNILHVSEYDEELLIS